MSYRILRDTWVYQQENYSGPLKTERVCVVGNGPLTEDQRVEIADCSRIVRFNDMKNKRPEDRVDVHVKRLQDSMQVCSGESCNERALKGQGYSLFPSCSVREDIPELAKMELRPTTGTMFLSDLQEADPDVDDIRIYGMNWNMTDTVHSRNEGLLIEKCCTKCKVSPTPTKNYLP